MFGKPKPPPDTPAWARFQGARCVDCLFFIDNPGQPGGTCRALPRPESVRREYWCGQFEKTEDKPNERPNAGEQQSAG